MIRFLRLSLWGLVALGSLYVLGPTVYGLVPQLIILTTPPAIPPEPAQKANKSLALPPNTTELKRVPLRYEEETTRLHSPPPPKPSPAQTKQRFYRVIVESAEVLKTQDALIRLSGIEAPAPDDTCSGAQGDDWPCGRMAQAALARLIRARAIECFFNGSDADGTRLGRCTVAGTDINEWMVRRGWARAKANSAYEQALHAAKQDGNGLWSNGDTQP